MDLDQIRRRAPVLWLFMGILVVLVCVLAGLQYYWIGEISVNRTEKALQDDLQAQVNKLGSDFNAEMNNAAAALQPDDQQVQDLGRGKGLPSCVMRHWRASAPHPLSVPAARSGEHREWRACLADARSRERACSNPPTWPEDWVPARDFFTERLAGRNNGPPRIDSLDVDRRSPIPRPSRFRLWKGRRRAAGELDWLLLDVDRDYAGAVLLPELLAPHLGDDFHSQYRVEVTDRTNSSGTSFTGAIQLHALRPSSGSRDDVRSHSAESGRFRRRSGRGQVKDLVKAPGKDKAQDKARVSGKGGRLEISAADAGSFPCGCATVLWKQW